jgi:hypothetical protein
MTSSRISLAAVFLLAAASCDAPTAPPFEGDPASQDRFGSLSVQIGGVRVARFTPADSVVGHFDPQTQQLIIVGQRTSAGSGPDGILTVRFCGVPQVGAFAFASSLRGIEGSWLGPGPAPRPRTTTQYTHFLSSGQPGDSLILEEADLLGDRLRGRFHFRGLSAGSRDTVTFRGQFAGRIARGISAGCPQ